MNVNILGIPMDLGAGRRGVDMGPSALRNAHLAARLRDLGHTVRDLGDVDVALPETLDKHAGAGLVFLDPILEACRATAEQLAALPGDVFPITLGGDHSVSMGTVTGNALRGNPAGDRTGLIWVDAHTDYNTPESSPSGNIHGMPVAHLTGLGDADLAGLGGGWSLRPEDIVMIGIRSVDAFERDLLREAGIKAYTMKEVDQLGITRITEETLERLGDVRRLHVSFDADALDPTVAPGVGTPVPGGLTYREGHLLMELLCESNRVTSLDIVEVNPVLDTRNQTAEVMVGMAASLLGQRIL
ncbi:arginase [Deinococcus metallilatus]|uniref:Arginase n=1 Tax=Deinococcus metallilatus TaxID=1211322 RepID=A0AAJ5F3N3_9DEIO|nr:arginase [Deinococcus metallilatus]MBB5296380.1 arginase [Deinococcus metallilatus]QBY09944.1 arginase [Deinococcus metallilatus]RXJ08668.1 arginase [Deinococcus metallilatus]TLK25142.1 arginase [Deinococcus metallilatus]GMA14707.1 arginase [Deinococcus metallilatus]